MIIIRIHHKHNEMYKHNSKVIRYNATLIPSSCMCCSYMLRVCGCVFVYSSFVCIFAFAYIFKSKVHSGNAVRFGRALPGYPITAHHLYAFLM